MAQLTLSELSSVVHEVVERQPITDMHTHLYSPNMRGPQGPLLLWGIDALLTYHYLVAEVMRWSDVAPDMFFDWPVERQADLIWQKLFIEHSPVSEAERGVLTSLKALGMDVRSRDLGAFRAALAGVSAEAAVRRSLQLANIAHVVMTNDPFDEAERAFWLSGGKVQTGFHAALRIDPLLRGWSEAVPRLQGWGYKVDSALGGDSVAEVQRFLREWAGRMAPLYMAVSLPPDFSYPDGSVASRVLAECILPMCREAHIPFAMMIGSERQVNPTLRLAGDGLGRASLGFVARLAREFPANRFFVTVLSHENQHELIVLGRKFRNLMVFGCWWFMNNPVIIEDMTRMRMELLGTSFIPQHSDARVLEQVIYKWTHSRAIIAKVLVDKYADLMATGWTLERAEIERDVADLLQDNFWRFVGKRP
ncbi:MAG: glucuronate isomerase [Chloroflexi bacterium]|nr:glucuronate isomerase [Chloroflexota bacterium]MCL5275301.1 glucuronate isomerase [Chloroflexota bacterium]